MCDCNKKYVIELAELLRDISERYLTNPQIKDALLAKKLNEFIMRLGL